MNEVEIQNDKTLLIPKARPGGLGAFSLPHLLLIAGNGRNVGKTTLACKIIKRLSQTEEVLGLKISPHFHSFNETGIAFKNEYFTIYDEKQINTKDSSLMLQAGAKQVFFVMVEPEKLGKAIEKLIQLLPHKPIVCESGGLHEFISPGLFLMVKRAGEKTVKTHFLKYSPIMVNNNGEKFDLDIQNIEFQNNKFRLKQ
jgi:hypothetical protein